MSSASWGCKLVEILAGISFSTTGNKASFPKLGTLRCFLTCPILPLSVSSYPLTVCSRREVHLYFCDWRKEPPSPSTLTVTSPRPITRHKRALWLTIQFLAPERHLTLWTGSRKWYPGERSAGQKESTLALTKSCVSLQAHPHSELLTRLFLSSLLSSRFYTCLGSVSQSCLPLQHMDCSRQAPLSMGFPRQESWSGLPSLLRLLYW